MFSWSMHWPIERLETRFLFRFSTHSCILPVLTVSDTVCFNEFAWEQFPFPKWFRHSNLDHKNDGTVLHRQFCFVVEPLFSPRISYWGIRVRLDDTSILELSFGKNKQAMQKGRFDRRKVHVDFETCSLSQPNTQRYTNPHSSRIHQSKTANLFCPNVALKCSLEIYAKMHHSVALRAHVSCKSEVAKTLDSVSL